MWPLLNLVFVLNVAAYFDKFVDEPDPLFVKSVIHHEPPDAEHLKLTLDKFEKEKKLKTKLPGIYELYCLGFSVLTLSQDAEM